MSIFSTGDSETSDLTTDSLPEMLPPNTGFLDDLKAEWEEERRKAEAEGNVDEKLTSRLDEVNNTLHKLAPHLRDDEYVIKFYVQRIFADKVLKGTKSVTVGHQYVEGGENHLELTQHVLNTIFQDFDNYLIVEACDQYPKDNQFVEAHNALITSLFTRLRELIILMLKNPTLKLRILANMAEDKRIDQNDLRNAGDLESDESIDMVARIYASCLAQNGIIHKPFKLAEKLEAAMYLYKTGKQDPKFAHIIEINPLEVIKDFRSNISRIVGNYQTSLTIFGETDSMNQLNIELNNYLNRFLNESEKLDIIFGSQKITFNEFNFDGCTPEQITNLKVQSFIQKFVQELIKRKIVKETSNV